MIDAARRKFWTGEPCLHGHVAWRYTSDSSCCACKAGRRQARSRDVPADRPRQPFSAAEDRALVAACSRGVSLHGVGRILSMLCGTTRDHTTLKRRLALLSGSTTGARKDDARG